jgi:hypothetical protein
MRKVFPNQSAIKAEPVAVKNFEGPGRGRKQCPSCEIYIGVRSKECPGCNHSFQRKPKVKVVCTSIDKERKIQRRRVTRKGMTPDENKGAYSSTPRSLVWTPSGKCPIKLESADKETVVAWMAKVREYGMKANDYFTSEALRYYVRYTYDIFSEEYKEACSHINEQDALEDDES